jgi:hypothetical protein
VTDERWSSSGLGWGTLALQARLWSLCCVHTVKSPGRKNCENAADMCVCLCSPRRVSSRGVGAQHAQRRRPHSFAVEKSGPGVCVCLFRAACVCEIAVMLVLDLWRALFLPATLSAGAAGTTGSDGMIPIYATARPLIGGPAFLPLHIQVAHAGVAYDFLPCNPSAAGTTATLLLGGSVEGRIRCRPVHSHRLESSWHLLGRTARSSDEVHEFAQRQSTVLCLRTRNCWSFAADLARFALVLDPDVPYPTSKTTAAGGSSMRQGGSFRQK